MGSLYTAAAAVTVTNTTTETSLLTTPLVLPPNLLVAGTTLRLVLWGEYQTMVGVPGTLRIRFKVTNATDGTKTIAETGLRTLLAAMNNGWGIECFYTQRTTGATAQSRGTGGMSIWTAATLAEAWLVALGTGSTDTTIPNTFDITAQFSVANVANIIVNHLAFIESIAPGS